jgi:diketogulonate reductase-like aldo/keto reductase
MSLCHCRHIGVSNCRVEHLLDINATARVLPAVNQAQMYVGRHDNDAIALCRRLGILYQAYSPLGPWHGKSASFRNARSAAASCMRCVSNACVVALMQSQC